ncbi:PIG-L family deacetylase [Ichthyenterobacterium sp. W332]|uniref:PIG-L family deacetylase n=1 Tax=Microcosmobacter mediterraneus TaxID=3075607 RepID=A0ABU2YHI8_9FLAO|nr:PIG-L family deacetylase [Ichthyenterobacterium sp. W332]MDT0557613.1 PIG-L family deacetylase [Ichthyenterobacterium sp. W332]
MFRSLTFLLTLVFSVSLLAQAPKKPNSSEIYEAIQKLNVLGSVLYVAAHPDDENTRLIAYMANHVKARTAYLSLTRGDGGQNLVGPELRELLGLIRTQELLAARRIDGGQQLFTRANDFGYSKHPDETLSIWDKNEVLSDVVLAIRKFKPDVIINRFDHRRAGRTHGHHTASALLSMEAFDLSNNPNSYPNQLSKTEVWQPKRLFYNTSWWRYGSREEFAKIDKSNMAMLDIGVYYPLKGLSNNELASMASSQHLCQGFGRPTTRGSQEEYIEFLKGDPLNNSNNVFEGIDTSWNRVKNGEAIGTLLYDVENNFNFKNPAVHLPQLMEAYKLISKLEDEHWKTIKINELYSIIESCLGLFIEVKSSSSSMTQNQTCNLDIEVLNRSDIDVNLVNYVLPTGISVSKNINLTNNTKFNFEEGFNTNTVDYTTPYWLRSKGTLGMYKADSDLIGLPETPRAFHVDFNLLINTIPITISKPVVYRYSKPDKGELYKPFEIVPEASAALADKVYIFENGNPKDVEVVVKAGKANLEGTIELAYPNDWEVYPKAQKISIANKGDVQKVVFTIIPPKTQSEGLITPMVKIGDQIYTRKLVEIDYAHIPFQTALLPSESKVVRLDIKKRGETIGYIEGAGDVVPESLEQIGYNVVIIDPNTITAELLQKFDAIVVGIRAYNTLETIKFKQQQLFDFVKAGGNLIVQYNTSFRLKVHQLAPYELKLSRDRVTDEHAEVRLLAKDHPILNFPNKITPKDFEGWTQERGLYFPNQWADAFTPILSMNDKGETPKDGSLLVAKYGKGHYIYTGLSFFREFPAGVSGAYRLFANMLSIGKSDINQAKTLDD